jgi:hypothetical protein
VKKIWLFLSVLACPLMGNAESSFDSFKAWMASGGSDLSAGEALALERRDDLLELMRSDPQEALELALSADEIDALPDTMQKLVERRVAGVANNSPFRPAVTGTASGNSRDLLIKGRAFRAYVFGDRLLQQTFSNESVNGIAIGAELAIECEDSGILAVARTTSSVDEKSVTTVVFNFSTNDLILGEDAGFRTVALPGCESPEAEPGTPRLPALFQQIELPSGVETAAVSYSVSEVLVGTGLTLYPVQPAIALSDTNSVFVGPDVAAYASTNRTPSDAVEQWGAVARRRGSCMLPVRINPLRYVPSSGELFLCTEIEVALEYSETSTATVLSTDSATADVVDYLVITSSGLSSAFETLTDHRETFNGYSTEIVTTDWIASIYDTTRPDGGSDTQTAIRNCIADYVATKGTTYVVLGGDDTIVPDRDCYCIVNASSDSPSEDDTIPTDLYYAGLDGTWDDYDSDGTYGEADVDDVTSQDEGDLYADVYVGRIPVRTSAQALAYINKVVDYENDPPANVQGKLLASGHFLWNSYTNDDRPTDTMYDGHLPLDIVIHPSVEEEEMWLRRAVRDCIQPYWDPKRVCYMFTTLTSWDTTEAGTYSACGSNLATKYSEGWQFVFNATHGSATALSAEANDSGTSDSFNTTDAASLTDLVVVFNTMACISGGFDKTDPSMSEAMLRNANGGALVYLGCSRYGWGSADAAPASDTSTGGTSCLYMREFMDVLFGDQIYDVGELFYTHKENYGGNGTSNGAKRWVMFGLNLQGDPGLTIPLETQNMEVETDSDALEIDEGGTAFLKVCLNKKPIYSQTVEVTVSGDSDVSISSGSTLSFTDNNWDTYQTVGIAAAADSDALNGEAEITLTLSDESTVVSVQEVDAEFNDAPEVAIISPVQRKAVLTEGSGIAFSASVVDDGGSASQTWSVEAGTSGSVIENAASLSTAITFPADGSYVVRLTASDGSNESYDEIAVEIDSAARPVAEELVPEALTAANGDIATILYYPFDAASGILAVDPSGGHDGTLSGCSWQTSGGVVNGALEFDGVDDEVTIADATDFNTCNVNQRTVALWFKTDTVSGRQIIYDEGGSWRGFNIYLDDDTLYVGGWNRGANTWSTTFLSDRGIVAGQWYHVAFVLDVDDGLLNDGFRAYLDGVEFSSGNGSVLSSHSDDNCLGGIAQSTYCHDGEWSASTATNAYHFDGLLDELVIYDEVLSDDEIKELGALPTLVRYPFDGDVADASFGEDYSGTLSGGSWIAGIWDQALGFDGSDDYLQIPGSDDFNLVSGITKRSFAFWFRADDLDGTQMIFEEGGQTRGINGYLAGSTLYVGGWNNGENGWNTTFLSTNGISTGTWYHVAIVLDADSEVDPTAFRGYLNGVQFGAGDGAALNRHTDACAIGMCRATSKLHSGNVSSSGLPFCGAVDEFVVYNRVLTADEVGELSAMPVGVDAGSDQTVGALASLAGGVDCDNPMSTIWEVSGGTIDDPTELETDVVFSEDGTYALRLTATANGLSAFDETAIKAEATADSDSDGYSNYEEYVAGTDANDGASALGVIGCAADAAGFCVEWVGGEEACQVLEYTRSLVDPDWIPVYTNYPPTAVTNAVVDSISTNTARFYRVRAYRE